MDKSAATDLIRDQVWSLFSSSGEKELGIVATFEDAVIVKDQASGQTFEAACKTEDGRIALGEPRPVDDAYITDRILSSNPDVTLKDLKDLLKTFEDWATGTMTGCMLALEGHPGIDNPEALCSWLKKQATGEWPSEKAKGPAEAELTGPIVMKNAAKKIAYAAVLVPGEADHDGETVTAEKIEEAAHEWLADYQNVDLQHSLNNVGRPVESYILPMDMEVEAYGQKMSLPKGSWIMASRFSDSVWDRVEKGELTGFSVMGIRRAATKSQAADTAAKNLDEAAAKRTLLKDLGPDWVPVYVSVVDSPCVPKAKFFALKSTPDRAQRDTEPETKTIMEKLKGIFTAGADQGANKEGRRLSAATVSALRKASEALNDLINQADAEDQDKGQKSLEGGIDVDETKVKEMIEAGIKEALDPITSKLEEITKMADSGPDASKAIDEEAQKAADEKAAEEAQKAAEAAAAEAAQKAADDKAAEDQQEAFKSEILKRLEQLEGKLSPGNAKAIKGQDTTATAEKSSDFGSRDAYGRNRPKQDK